MSFTYSDHTIIGTFKGEILSGKEPLPWIMFKIPVAVTLYDRRGERTILIVNERVVIQGTENIKAARFKLKDGCEILAKGQRVPAFAVMGDEENTRGTVLLAALFQVSGGRP